MHPHKVDAYMYIKFVCPSIMACLIPQMMDDDDDDDDDDVGGGGGGGGTGWMACLVPNY